MESCEIKKEIAILLAKRNALDKEPQTPEIQLEWKAIQMKINFLVDVCISQQKMCSC